MKLVQGSTWTGRTTWLLLGTAVLASEAWFLGPPRPGTHAGPHEGSLDQAPERVSFGAVRPLPSVEVCAASKAFNPDDVRLDARQMDALDGAIQAYNRRLSELEKRKRALAHEWARQRLDLGAFQLLDGRGKAKIGPRGRIAIVDAAVGQPGKLVSIGPGEYAPLDVADQDLRLFAAGARSAVIRYFASHGNPIHLEGK